ncbi:MAG: pyridoxamine 5'-phosphate oxidase family protein [Aquificaceae bacterium]|nr:pyridoxamine 5'-phosphate oxidase family protein [Aquificaceae bacterium]MDW8423151.1 pyridoxamine 5'-phosphate oxidase family protein [Aquificaceae bacterium]
MLPKDLVDLMRSVGVFPAILATADKEGIVHLTFITWVYPVDDKTIRIALSYNAKSAKNILQTGQVALMLVAQDKALACYGSASLIEERIEEVKFPVSVFEVKLSSVENNLFPGGTITGTIPFMHTGDLQRAGELDQLVLDALKTL